MQRAQHGKCQQAARQQISPCAHREQQVTHHQHHHARKTIHQIPTHKARQHRSDAVPRHHPADGVLIRPELAAQIHRKKRCHEHEGEEKQEIRHPGAGIVRRPQSRNRLVLNAGIHGRLHLYAPPFPRSITKSAIVTWNHFNLQLQYIQDRADFVQTKPTFRMQNSWRRPSVALHGSRVVALSPFTVHPVAVFPGHRPHNAQQDKQTQAAGSQTETVAHLTP